VTDYQSRFVDTHCAPPTAPHITYCYLQVDTPGMRFHDPSYVTCSICRRKAKDKHSFWESRAWLSAVEHEKRQASPPAPAGETNSEPEPEGR
jgi:hypothetical protein